MMRYKYLLLSVLYSTIYAVDYNQFESFNNVIYIGLGVGRLNLSNNSHDSALASSVSYQLGVERLFKNQVWMDLNGSITVSSLTSQNNGIGSSSVMPKSPFNQNPNLGGVNLNLGYAYLLSNVLYTPFINIGRNTNLASSTLYFNNNRSITNDFYYTLGLGTKFDYIINQSIMLYIKLMLDYNWDQSGALNGVMPQNNIKYNVIFGAKFNIYKNLQLGINGYYDYYQATSDLPIDPNTGKTIYSPSSNNGYGGNITFGVVY